MKKSEKKFDKKEYLAEYKRKKYDRIALEVPAGQKEVLKERASKQNKSLQQYIKDAIEHYNKMFE